MAISNGRAYKINLLQDNLQTIRKIAGWTIDELGERIGVSKQTISNIENANTRMSLTQYIAIRAVLEYEVREHPEMDVLPKVVQILLDESQQLADEDYVKIKEAINAIAAAASGGADRAMLSAIFSGVIDPLLVGTGIELVSPLNIEERIVSPYWLKAILGKDEDASK